MQRKTVYFTIVVWLAMNFVIALFVFASGLLLHRSVLPNRALCSSMADLSDPSSSSSLTRSNGQVCVPSNFKVILVIIDALRHDFIQPQRTDDLKNKTDALFYTNKLTIISDLIDNESANCKLFKFIADPPTTTTQRIIGLTSGSLPTFIQVGSNFATVEINEDNLIDLLQEKRRNAVFLGDDTWSKIYPNRFIRHYPFDSFNVWDLDTVDTGIRDHLFSELEKDDWSLLVAHFLGVDHCGHRYGPHHPEMQRKLLEMNDVIKRIIEKLRGNADTLLFVVGDHGMTTTGDHGGDTENEITSALFAYSPVHPLFDGYGSRLSSISDTVNQVDLVPTLSSILGLPIPFSSVGSTILQCMPAPLVDSTEKIAVILQSNARQITDYVKAYSLRDSRFDAAELDAVLVDHNSLTKNFEKITRDHHRYELVELLDAYEAYMNKVLQMCRRAWVQFDTFNILIGLIFLLTSSFGGYCLINGFSLENTRTLARQISLSIGIRQLVLIGVTISLLFGVAVIISAPLVRIAILIELCSLFAMIWLYFRYLCCPNTTAAQFSATVPVSTTATRIPTTVIDWFVLFCTVCSFLVFFSNSYVVEESSIILFFMVSSLWFILALTVRRRNRQRISQATNSSNRVIEFCKSELSMCAAIVCLALRLAIVFVKCREAEQQPRCKDIVSSKHLETHLSTVSCFLNASLLFVFVYVWPYAKCGDDMRSTVLRYVAKFCSSLLAVHWIFPHVHFLREYSTYSLLEHVPSIVFVVSLCSLCYLFSTWPVSCDQYRRRTSPLSAYDATYANIIVFVALLSCVLSASIYVIPSLLAIITLSALAVFLKTSSSSLLSRWDGYLTMDSELSSSGRTRSASPFFATASMYVPWSHVFLWSMCAHYAFYTSGHYASFSAIQWHSAFLFRKEIGNSLLVPSLLIVVSNFASYLAHGIALPMLLTVWSSSGSSHSYEFKKNVVDAYDIFYHRVFVLVSKYILFLGFRLFFVALSAFSLCKHLMMWKIFAPKFVFESIIFVVSIVPSSVAAFLLLSKMENRITLTAPAKKTTKDDGS